MTANERIASIRAKIERAGEHINELEAEVQLFLKANPYIVGTKRDEQTRRPIYYLVIVRETPTRMSTITGDVIHNLRSALDHLADHLVRVAGGTPSNQTGFPISRDAAKYKAEQCRKTKGMGPDAIKEIDKIKPYGGGNNTLWGLHQLDIVDKHRLLITIGSAYKDFNIRPIIHREIKQLLGNAGLENTDKIPMPDLFLIPDDRMSPLKAGDELFSDLPDAEVNDQIQFRFEIAFGEPQVVKGEPLIKTLRQMIDTVDKIVLSFKPLLVLSDRNDARMGGRDL